MSLQKKIEPKQTRYESRIKILYTNQFIINLITRLFTKTILLKAHLHVTRNHLP